MPVAVQTPHAGLLAGGCGGRVRPGGGLSAL